MGEKIIVVVASNNAGKIHEFRKLLPPERYTVLSQSEAGAELEVEETGTTFEDNAALKVEAVEQVLADSGRSGNIFVIADDSGLVVDALNGEPGVYSARYAPEGRRKATILAKLEGVPEEARTARFVCCIACTKVGSGVTQFVRGECEGRIGYECRGTNGFGYDPIFMVGEKSFAEMSDAEKNAVSHRGRAMRKLPECMDEFII